jgi:hypothetical protein
MFGLVSFGLIGFWDDYAKVRRKQNLGLTVKQKFGLQILAALIVGFMLLALHAQKAYSTSMNVPFFKSFKPDLLIDSLLRNWYTYPLAFVFFFAFMMLVIVGSSDAVNLTDGLDGLAIGLMLIASFAMTALTYVTGHAQFARVSRSGAAAGRFRADHLLQLHGGRVARFLWYNAHPAEIFMGDVGSLALGGALGVVAVLDQAGDFAAVYRRRLCDRSAVGDSASGQLQAAQEADLQNGADSSSFRATGVGRVEDHHAVLDRGIGDGAVRADDVEVAIAKRDAEAGGMARVVVVGWGVLA